MDLPIENGDFPSLRKRLPEGRCYGTSLRTPRLVALWPPVQPHREGPQGRASQVGLCHAQALHKAWKGSASVDLVLDLVLDLDSNGAMDGESSGCILNVRD